MSRDGFLVSLNWFWNSISAKGAMKSYLPICLWQLCKRNHYFFFWDFTQCYIIMSGKKNDRKIYFSQKCGQHRSQKPKRPFLYFSKSIQYVFFCIKLEFHEYSKNTVTTVTKLPSYSRNGPKKVSLSALL